MSFENLKITNSINFQPLLQLKNQFAIDTPIWGNNLQFMPTTTGIPSFESYFLGDFSQVGMQNPFGLMNFSMPQMDYTKLLENAIKMQNECMKIIQERQQIALQNIKLNQNSQTYTPETPENVSYDAKELKSKWASKKPHLTDGFYEKVVQIAKRINCDPNSLMAVMNAESGIDASAKNKKGSASGLIQFIESTAESLGTTTKKLRKMSAEEQLEYVEKYLTKTKNDAGLGSSFIDSATLYSLIFLPGRSKNDVLTTKGEEYYAWNTCLDTNGDGRITKAELGQRVQSFMA